MSNLVRQFPAGVPSNGTYPSAALNYIDEALPKIPNATDGSTHTGSCGFGGLKAPHMTTTTTALQILEEIGGAVDQVRSVILDFDVAGHHRIQVNAQEVVNWQLTLDLRNTRVGDTIHVEVEALLDLSKRLDLVWAGAGITHKFAPWEGHIQAGELVVWSGRVVTNGSGNIVQWTTRRYA